MIKTGIVELNGQLYVLLEEDFIKDLKDLGYTEIDIHDLVEEYEAWVA